MSSWYDTHLRPLRAPRPFAYRRGWFPLRLFPLLFVVAIVLAATDHFPWIPVIALAAVLVILGTRRRRGWGGRGRPRGWAC